MVKTLPIILAAIVLTGCAVDDEQPPAPSELSLYQRLASRQTLTLEPTSMVGVMAYDDAGNELPCVQPSVNLGQAVLRGTTRGLVILEGLHVELTDVKVAEGVLDESDVMFTDIRLRLGTQLVLEPDWGTRWLSAAGGGQADLLLDWSVLDESGGARALATQKLEDAHFAVDIRLDYDGSILASVTMSVDGELGSSANGVSLADFSMALQAKTPALDVD